MQKIKLLILTTSLVGLLAVAVNASEPSSNNNDYTIDLAKVAVSAISLVIGGGIVALLKSGAKSQIDDSIEFHLKPQIIEIEKLKLQINSLQTRQEIHETRFAIGLTNLGDRMESKIDAIAKRMTIHDEMLEKLTATLSELKIDLKVLVSNHKPNDKSN